MDVKDAQERPEEALAVEDERAGGGGEVPSVGGGGRDAEARIREALGSDQGEDWVQTACEFITAYLNDKKRRKEWDCSTVGKRIRTARELAGMSQEQFAFRIEAKQLHVSAWERGKADLPVRKLPGIAMSLGVTVAWLLMESEEGGPKLRNGILRKNQPLKLIRYMRQKAAIKAARAEATRQNELRQKALTQMATAPNNIRRKPKKRSHSRSRTKKSEEPAP